MNSTIYTKQKALSTTFHQDLKHKSINIYGSDKNNILVDKKNKAPTPKVKHKLSIWIKSLSS